MLPHSKSFKLTILPISLGMLPDKRLSLARKAHLSATNFPNCVGILPERLFSLIYTPERNDKLPISVGMAPEMKLCWMLNSACRFRSEPISMGTEPLRRLCSSCSRVTCVKHPMPCGRVPLIREFPSIRKMLRNFSLHRSGSVPDKLFCEKSSDPGL